MNFFDVILVQPLLNALILIYSALPLHNFGIAIILLTLGIRGILWPLQSQTLRNQKALNKIQPEVKKIQEKYKNDPAKVQQLTMELYKEKEVNPLSSCLPTLIQLPLLFALFYALIKFKNPAFIDVLNPNAGIYAYLYPWVKNLGFVKEALSVPFSTMFLGVDLTKPNVIFAVVAGAAQFFQTKQMMPKGGAKDPQMASLSFMTYTFPLLTVFVALSLPAALPLYWTVTTGVAVLQQWLVMRHDVEELDKEALIEVEAEESKAEPKKLKSSKKK